MQGIKIRAYAKVNLTLEVKGRCADGYHEISTIFQSIDLHDTVFLTPGRGIELEVRGRAAPRGADNLAYRAASLLQGRYPFPGVKITLEKRIPLAAGLAGGSADAAAVLVGLNYLWDLGLTAGALAGIGAELGSDVPFCVLGGTALGRGRGERLALLPPPPRLWLVLVKPPFGVSTAAVYRGWDAGLASGWEGDRPREEEAVAALLGGNREGLVRSLGNVLEGVTLRLYPEVATIKGRLMSMGAEKAVLCGSGPTVFGVAPTREEAERIAAALQREYPETVVACTLSP
ncbi:MAG: 4-(cytidine 5'-diphospho)-2-C-methyl-D-erythritol kinase [Thermoanaerobacteraceae bacterium]|nr:4-(cytidine 5'-diphospho)-2-C-methyl-D-erythritol kinase [Thermoanaerobacteraceae bacterium]